jgi:hypothetical protein
MSWSRFENVAINDPPKGPEKWDFQVWKIKAHSNNKK